MFKMIGSIYLVLLGFDSIYGWNFDYIDINPEVDVTDITFQLYSTRYPETRRPIFFDEATGTASIKDEAFFNSSIPTKIIAHGNGGGIKLGRVLWEYYTEAATKNGKHYNVIEILWGSGPIMKHAWTGIKTAKVVKSFYDNYGLKIEDIHGIGFSFGAHVISGMATELIDAGLGKIDRLTLLDPGCKVPTKLRIDGKKQYGLINKDDAMFVDVFHTGEKYGISKKSVGDVDVWVNGGIKQPPTMSEGSHKSAVYFFARTITMTSLDECSYVAWKCIDRKWSPFKWERRNKKKSDTCDFGDLESENGKQVVGEYIDRDEASLSTGNFVFFTDDEYGYCKDLKCKQVC